jgi:hypothetical protein
MNDTSKQMRDALQSARTAEFIVRNFVDFERIDTEWIEAAKHEFGLLAQICEAELQKRYAVEPTDMA